MFLGVFISFISSMFIVYKFLMQKYLIMLESCFWYIFFSKERLITINKALFYCFIRYPCQVFMLYYNYIMQILFISKFSRRISMSFYNQQKSNYLFFVF
jgi:hypothetical protein